MDAKTYDLLREVIYPEGPEEWIGHDVIVGRYLREIELAAQIKLPNWAYETLVQIILRERGYELEQAERGGEDGDG